MPGHSRPSRTVSRLQASVTAAARHGCCTSLLLLRGQGGRPNYISGLHPVFTVPWIILALYFLCVETTTLGLSHYAWAVTFRGETPAVEVVRDKRLGWKRLTGINLLFSANLSWSCCCAMPSTQTSVTGDHSK